MRIMYCAPKYYTNAVKTQNAPRSRSSKLLYVNIQESKEKGILENRNKWLQYAAEVNITKDSVGYMKPLVTTVIINDFCCYRAAIVQGIIRITLFFMLFRS
jgi:hypothetical protein